MMSRRLGRSCSEDERPTGHRLCGPFLRLRSKLRANRPDARPAAESAKRLQRCPVGISVYREGAVLPEFP